ncbi:hypothetical protein EJ08DRAFT_652033 [Tothia fuscella]|uniref:Uncharacterized protein n=1 Tax=Tothia fuscella TaxID=1048955 RepID=A0A9P4NLD4_9PEZI|nr:hypothetical protein EJ08DRAFT_652033 [Tothia fuscella]
MGEGEVTEKGVGGEKKTVWVPKEAGWVEGSGLSYSSINAHSLDAGKDGLDLREWHEKSWISYLDCLDEKEADRFELPHRGGAY